MDVWFLLFVRDAVFLEESVDSHRGWQRRQQHLDRHRALMFQVGGEIDRSHASPANFPFDRVTIAQAGLEAFENIIHEGKIGV